MRWNACVHRLDLGLYSHPKEFWGNEVRTHFNSKGKIPSTGKKNSPQRRIEPTTLHPAGQRAQHTTNELFRPLGHVFKTFTRHNDKLSRQAHTIFWQNVYSRRSLQTQPQACNTSLAYGQDSRLESGRSDYRTRPSYISEANSGTVVLTLAGDRCHTVSARTGWPGISIL